MSDEKITPKYKKPEPENAVHITDATPLRLKFSKTGDLQYISHLDLNRTMQRIMLRAGLPVWYSEGFNPKPKLVFAAPLSVGCESLCEYVDIRLLKSIGETGGADGIIGALNAASTPELRFTDAYEPLTKLSAIGFAGYRLLISSGGVTETTAAAAEELFSAPVILKKRTKSGEKDADITPFIKKLTFSVDGGALRAEMRLAADNAAYLNPEYVVTALKNNLSLLSGDITREYYTLTRTELYLADGETPFR